MGRADLCLSPPLPPGELKDPSRAIPLGTIVAVTYTFFIYTLLFFLSGFTCDRCLGKGPAWPLRGWSGVVAQGCHTWIIQDSTGWGAGIPHCRGVGKTKTVPPTGREKALPPPQPAATDRGTAS